MVHCYTNAEKTECAGHCMHSYTAHQCAICYKYKMKISPLPLRVQWQISY